MIELLTGQVAYVENSYVTVLVQGIGYQVFVTNPFVYQEQEEILLYTHQVVREDAHHLYGFITRDERDLFRLLLEVSGIGPKAALSMMGSGTPKDLVTAIQLENVKVLTKIPGIGKKTAQRIVLDLQDKLKKLGWERRFVESHMQPIVTKQVHHIERDVIDALIGLGYNEDEAQTFVHEAERELGGESLSIEEWIKRALQASMKS